MKPARLPMGRQIDLGGYLSLWFGWAKRLVATRFTQSALEDVWLFVQPAFQIAVYALFFNIILGVEGDDLPYLTLVVSGTLLYRFVSIGLSNVTALMDQRNVIGTIYFPREVPALAQVLSGVVDLLIGVVAIVIVGAVQHALHISLSWIMLVPELLLLFVWVAALAVIFTTLSAFVRDVAYAVPYLLQGLFFVSPVTYPANKLPVWANVVNPLAVVLEGVRDILFRGGWASWKLLLLHGAIGTVLLVLAVLHLRAVEHRITEVV